MAPARYLRRCLLSAAAVAGLLLILPGNVVARETLFQRLSNGLKRSSPVHRAAASDQEDVFESMSNNLVDMWETDPLLKTASRLLDGDHFGVLNDMVANTQLDEIWMQPEQLRHILTAMPMLKSIRGIDEIAAKDTLTPDDGLKALGLFRKMMEAVPGKMQEVMDPGLFAAKLKEYATTDDAEVQSLFKQVEGGDLDAFRKLQQTIADKELGGLIDLDAFGMNGQEPEQLRMMRELVQSEEPDLFQLMHMDDPIVKAYIEDPTLAYREAMATAGIKI